MNDILNRVLGATATLLARAAAPQAGPTANAEGPAGAVTVNRQPLDPATLVGLRAQLGPLLPGRYWYDHATGAWGEDGGPTARFIAAALPLPGPLPRDASGGGHGQLSGVFINGRELHPLDVARLRARWGVVWPGHWWVDAGGRFGALSGGQRGPALGRLGDATADASAAGAWSLASADGRRWVGVDSDGVASANGVNGERWFGS